LAALRPDRRILRIAARPLWCRTDGHAEAEVVIAPVLVAFAAAPIFAGLWVLVWLVGDLFAGPVRAPVQIRSKDDRER